MYEHTFRCPKPKKLADYQKKMRCLVVFQRMGFPTETLNKS